MRDKKKIIKLADSWTDEDGELTIPNPVEEWDEETRRQVYIYNALAEQSKETQKAFDRLFKEL